ncbi:Rid family hydrolase [Stutzerimonas stutzeri]|nr:Rid family hydrolase [Stutzerimonas stutzeri]
MNIRPIQTLGYLNPPWTEHYGYAQVDQLNDQLHVVGLMSHDTAGNLIGPAPVDAEGMPTDLSNMAVQLRTAYANANRLLTMLGASLDDVIEETLFVVDLAAVANVAADVRQQAYGNPWPQCRSKLVSTHRLLFSEQLVEIGLTAKIPLILRTANQARRQSSPR